MDWELLSIESLTKRFDFIHSKGLVKSLSDFNDFILQLKDTLESYHQAEKYYDLDIHSKADRARIEAKKRLNDVYKAISHLTSIDLKYMNRVAKYRHAIEYLEPVGYLCKEATSLIMAGKEERQDRERMLFIHSAYFYQYFTGRDITTKGHFLEYMKEVVRGFDNYNLETESKVVWAIRNYLLDAY